MTRASLPSGFEALNPFTARWTGETAEVRSHLRDTASREQLQAFFSAMEPLLEEALDYLDGKGFADHDVHDRQLMYLLLSYAHVAMAVEVQRGAEPSHALLRPFMKIVTAPADRD